MKIGLFGLGTVGQGLLKMIREGGHNIEVVGVVDRSYQKKKDILGNIPASDDVNFLLERDDLDAIVELIGGLDLPLFIVREAIDKKIPVVTANKALIAEHGYTLLNKAQLLDVKVSFEAAVTGAIPIIHNLLAVFKHDNITRLEGILNGTSNYILTEMRRKKVEYGPTLKKAQELGYAEADPTLDVGGLDATHKLAILASLISNTWVEYNHVNTRGITEVSLADIHWAEKMNYRLRLIGRYQRQNDKNFLSVEPTLITSDHFLWDIELENNAILIEAENSKSHLMVGKGAGALPTAFSVLNDLLAINEPKKFAPDFRWEYARLAPLSEMRSPFYLRLRVGDEPGVLAQIASILGENKISIASVQQDIQYKTDDEVDLVIVTHSCERAAMTAALQNIESQQAVKNRAVYLPIDE